jgi:hypothetical protein
MMPDCFSRSRSRLGPDLGLMRLLVSLSSYFAPPRPDDLKRFKGLQPVHVSLICVYRSLILSIVVGCSVAVLGANNVNLKKILVSLVEARFKLKKEVLSSLYNLTLPGLNEERHSRHHIVGREPGRQILGRPWLTRAIGVRPTPPLTNTTGLSSFSLRKNSPAGGKLARLIPIE